MIGVFGIHVPMSPAHGTSTYMSDIMDHGSNTGWADSDIPGAEGR
jgi:hypothetical protein